MPSTHIDLISHWHVDAPITPVWAALADLERWPQWWPGIARVRGQVRWTGRWPPGLAVEIDTLRATKDELLRLRSRGACQGEAVWLLRAEPHTTTITAVWRIELRGGWARTRALLLGPLIQRVHRRVMQAGEAGLRQHLLAELARGSAGKIAP